MSDFDKIINDRLNEDDGEYFPSQEANWDKMSQRLAAFETANPLPTAVPKPVLTAVWKRWAWTSAAAALIGVSGLLFWHFNEVKTLEQQNEGLAKELVELKATQQPRSGDTVIERKVTVETNTTVETTKTLVQQSSGMSGSNKGTKTPVLSNNSGEKTSFAQKETVVGIEQKQGNASKNKQNAAIFDNKSNNNKQEGGQVQNPKQAIAQKRNSSQIAEMGNKNLPNNVSFDKKNAPLNAQKTEMKENIAVQIPPSVSSNILEGTRTNVAQNKPVEGTLVPKTGDINVQLDQKNLDKVELTAQIPPSVSQPNSDKKDDIETVKTAVATVENTKIDTAIKTQTAVQPDNKIAENTPPPTIIPVPKKSLKRFLPRGLALGIEGFYGEELPDVRGIMPTTGKGLSAELMLTKNISLTASADLLETHFDVGERPRRFHVKDEPNPPKPNVGLHKIRGERNSRLLSLNAKYVFGQKWWVQPSVSLGHSWQKIEGKPMDFVYKDFLTGDETPVVVQIETEKIRSLWQLGVGLEKKIKRFTVGVSAEMQKDFSRPTDPNAKMIASSFGILRGGVKFNIF